MGQKVKNVEAVTDYADGRHFVRLHRDIPLPAEVCEAVRRHLAAGRWEEAGQITLEHAPDDAARRSSSSSGPPPSACGPDPPRLSTRHPRPREPRPFRQPRQFPAAAAGAVPTARGNGPRVPARPASHEPKELDRTALIVITY